MARAVDPNFGDAKFWEHSHRTQTVDIFLSEGVEENNDG